MNAPSARPTNLFESLLELQRTRSIDQRGLVTWVDSQHVIPQRDGRIQFLVAIQDDRALVVVGQQLLTQ